MSDRRKFLRAQRRVFDIETSTAVIGFWEKFAKAVRNQDHALIAAFKASPSYAHLDCTAPPAPYRRKVMNAGAILYRFRNAPRHELCVIFTGNKGRFAAPRPLVIDAIGKPGRDILMLTDAAVDHYRSGLDERVPDVPSMQKFIARVARPYARMVVMGSSMGAAMALGTAARLNAARGIGIGVRPPWDVGRMIAGRRPNPYSPICACAAGDFSRTLWLAGADHAEDCARAASTSRLLGGTFAAIPKVAEHVMLVPFVNAGQLRPLLTMLTDLDTPLHQIAEGLRAGKPELPATDQRPAGFTRPQVPIPAI